MPTSVISGIVLDPSGTPVANTTVRARIIPKGAIRISDSSTITEIESTTTDGSGNWSLTLEEQSNIFPANTYYAVEEVLPSSAYNQYAIVVPANNSNVEAVKVGYVTPGTPLTSLPITPGSHEHPEYEESTDITVAVAAHEGAGDPHPVYATDSDLTAHAATSHGTAHPDLAAHDTLGLATDTELTTHAADTTSVHGIADTSVLATDTEVATAVSNHAAAADPHPGYVTTTEGTTLITNHEAAANPHPTYETSVEAAAKITAHEALADPHPGYLTTAEGNAAYEPAGTVSTHAGAADPHTGYQKESEKGAASGYASLDSGTLVPVVQLATGTPDGTKFLRDDRTWVLPTGGGGVSIPQQDDEPVGSVEDDLWIDTNEGAGVGLSSIIAFAEHASSQSSITTETTLTGTSVTITVPAGRRLRVSAGVHVQQNSATGIAILRLKEGATTIGRLARESTVNGDGRALYGNRIISPSAGAHTYHLSLSVSGGTVSTDVTEMATFILVEDITGTLWPAGQSVSAGIIAPEEYTVYTPTDLNITVGNGVRAARYIKQGRKVEFQWQLSWGTTTSIGGNVEVGVPFPCQSGSFWGNVCGTLRDAGTRHYPITGVINFNTGQAATLFHAESGNFGIVNGSNPATFGNGDLWIVGGTYEAAS